MYPANTYSCRVLEQQKSILSTPDVSVLNIQDRDALLGSLLHGQARTFII